MKPCKLCQEQARKPRYTDPHEHLRPYGEERIYRGAMTGGYEEQDFICEACNSKLTYSNDKNDYGWFLHGRKGWGVSQTDQSWKERLHGCFGNDDKKFALHSADEIWAREFKKLLVEMGVTWAQVEMEVHRALEGCTPDHIDEQTKAAKRLLCFGEDPR